LENTEKNRLNKKKSEILPAVKLRLYAIVQKMAYTVKQLWFGMTGLTVNVNRSTHMSTVQKNIWIKNNGFHNNKT
jgi:hypothetical protein